MFMMSINVKLGISRRSRAVTAKKCAKSMMGKVVVLPFLTYCLFDALVAVAVVTSKTLYFFCAKSLIPREGTLFPR